MAPGLETTVMGIRIFLDVGAYVGDTASAVLSSNHHFDKIYCFEPQTDMCELIKGINSDKITVCNFGLWKEDCVKTLYWSRHKDGATIYPDKPKEPRRSIKTVDGKFVKASKWFADNLKHDDYVVLKINCEGAECDIMDDLFQSEEYKKIRALMIDFDVRKIPSQHHREHEIRNKLQTYRIPSIFIVEKRDFGRWNYRQEAWTHYWMDKVLKDG